MSCERLAIGNWQLAIGNGKRRRQERRKLLRRRIVPSTSLRTGNRQPQKGFSLVEVMIVIVIMGLLAGVVTVNVRGYLTKAKVNTARSEIATIVKALDTFYGAYSRYPDNSEGIGALTKASDRIPEPLLSGEPVDPWGNPYQYNSPGSSGPYEVICYGADGREGGQGVDADITSSSLSKNR